MSDLRELYQEQILDHNKQPRNFRQIAEATAHAEGHNRSCGDQLTVYLKLNEDVIEDISFEGKGCAISKASASMMTAALKGKTVAEAETLFETFHDMVASEEELEEEELEQLGKLAAFAGVREYPSRVKCASLAWHTLHAALDNPEATVSTE
jgi:nitrogen fixation protein NifU and related proteins